MGKRTLAALLPGDTGVVSGENAGRLRDLGIITGTKITCLQKSPLGDPVAYGIRGAVFAIRREDADKIAIQPCGEVEPWD